MKKVIVASKKVKDFDYLELAIEEFIENVENSPKGQFALKYGNNIELVREYRPDFFEHLLKIVTEFDNHKLLEFYLRFDNFSD